MSIDFDALREATRSVDHLDDRIMMIADAVFEHRIAGVSLAGGSGGGNSPLQWYVFQPSVGLLAAIAVVKSITLKRVILYTPTVISGNTGQVAIDILAASIDPALALGAPGSAGNPFQSIIGNGTPIGQAGVSYVYQQETLFAGWVATTFPALTLLQVMITAVSGFFQVGVAIEY